jgi:hypothetical protein
VRDQEMAENEQLQQLLDAVKIIIDPNEPGIRG